MMSTTYEIKNRLTGAVLYAGGGESLRDVVVQAVGGGADLRGADLSGADLRGADLSGHKLIGERPILQIGSIGSRADYLVAYLTDAGVMIRAGCFFGTLDAFRAACIETHGENVHGREYAAAITLIEAHAGLWAGADATAPEAA